MTESARRRHLRVLDVMTTRVITADPLDGFKAVAGRLYETGLSALPVVDDHGRVPMTVIPNLRARYRVGWPASCEPGRAPLVASAVAGYGRPGRGAS